MVAALILPAAILVAAAGITVAIVRPLWIAYVLVLAAPVGLVKLPGGLQVCIALSIAVVGVAVALRLQRKALPLPRSFSSLMALLWTCGIVVGLAFGPGLGPWTPFAVWQIVAVLLAVSWPEFAGRPGQMRPLLIAWLVGGIAVALTGPLMSSESLQAQYGGSVVTGRPVGIFGQPNEYGLFCMLLLVFALGLIALTDGWVRWLSVVAAGVSAVGLTLSLSRGAWLGAIAGIVVLALVAPQTRRPLVATATVGVAALAAVLLSPINVPVVSVVLDRMLSITDVAANPYDERTVYRAEGMRQWTERPFLGQGANTFPETSTGVHSLGAPGGAEHPHSFVIAVGAEQGLVGLAAVLGFALAVAVAARRGRHALLIAQRANREFRAQGSQVRTLPPLAASVTVCAAAALAGFAIEGFADYPLRNALSRTSVWLLVGWALAGQRILAKRESSPSPTASDTPEKALRRLGEEIST